MLFTPVVAVFVAGAFAATGFKQEDFLPPHSLAKKSTDVPAPIVDVGYGKYQGYYNSTFNLNIYRGVRYAAPPKRWQLPESPVPYPEIVSQAVDDPPRCPQAPIGDLAKGDWDATIYGNEDCLFLNVFSPADAKKLPVLFWIHGGGYGGGSAAGFDFSQIAQRVGNGFVTVVIQYRLGAFGFASSEEIFKKGVPNAGLHDMQFALKWTQKHIANFGGDPDKVTIAGESAGGGSVMLMAVANGGKDGTRLFRRVIASSPYLPTQPNYNEGITEDYYRQLAERAGCKDVAKGSWFECLSDAGSLLLQNASALTTLAAKYGQWAFIPVTDGSLLKDRPTQLLLSGQINGDRVLAGNNANEGTYFVPQNITTEDQFKAYLLLQYPQLSQENLKAVMELYSIPSNITAASPKFDSDGIHAPYATAVSHFTVGWQQAANNLYAETTFVCPAYWLADAYTPTVNSASKGKVAWRYQFSVPDAFHAADIAPLVNDPSIPGQGMDRTFRTSFQSLWGRFIVTGDPTLAPSGDSTGDSIAAASSRSWKPWGTVGNYTGGNGKGYPLLNLNVTATTPQTADWQVADGNAWEGGRGARCALWARLGLHIRE